MCNLSEGIVDRVTEQVTKSVTKEVTLKKDIDSVKALMRNTGWHVEQAMAALDIPKSMRLTIMKALAN